ncbi:MAG: TonB-dependent receptor [Gammaproteobacteria bacterium]|nr:TonB-dependent receptor [Gammaproteobacteria bacterium]
MRFTNRKSMAMAVLVIATPPVASAQDDEDAHHEMDQIVVTAAPLGRTVEQLAQPTTILRGDELAKKQSTSIGETLSQEPGMSSTYFGPVSSRPVIRGQYGERVRVLSNGLDSLDASALSEDHQVTVDGLLADRIEIVRGPATLLYGSGAAGGLVNVVDSRFIDKPLDKPFSAGVALGADSAVGNRDAAVRSHFGSDSIAFSFDYFTRSTDNVEIPGFAESAAFIAAEEAEGGGEEEEGEEAFGVVENTDSETSSGAVGVSFVGDKGFLGVSFSGFDSKYGIPGHHHHEEEDPGMPPAEEEEEEVVRIDLDQTRVDVNGEYDLDGRFVSGIRFRAAVNDYKHTELEGAEIGTVFDVQGSDNRLELRHAPWGDLEGAIGIQYKQVDFDAIGDEAFVPASDTTRLSLFVFEELRLNDSWVLQGSARFEDQEISGATLGQQYDDGAFGASIGAIWRPLEDIRISANLAMTERHPTTAELYSDGPHIAAQRFERGSVALGNGILELEESTNLDLTVHGDTGPVEWTITGFINSVDNYILLRPTTLELDELPVFDYGQADVDFVGIEAQALVELWDRDDSHVHLSVFADFVNAEEDVSGAYLPRIPPSRVGFGLHGGWNKYDASIDATFAADQDGVAENELPTEGYTLLNLSLSYTFDEPDLYVFLRGSNMLDEEIRQHTSPLKDLIPLPGRSVHLGLRYEF